MSNGVYKHRHQPRQMAVYAASTRAGGGKSPSFRRVLPLPLQVTEWKRGHSPSLARPTPRRPERTRPAGGATTVTVTFSSVAGPTLFPASSAATGRSRTSCGDKGELNTR